MVPRNRICKQRRSLIVEGLSAQGGVIYFWAIIKQTALKATACLSKIMELSKQSSKMF